MFINVPLEKVHQELHKPIQRMAVLAETFKPNVLAHLDRIRGYSYILARGVGLSRDEADLIAKASMLHDVGMVSVPTSISRKESKLTTEEWTSIKRHPHIGADILQDTPSPILQAGIGIALTHHERWDGSGYPKGLRGNKIPIGGRICALADVFDSLTTVRPYGAPLSVEVAMKHIRQGSGSYFDPHLVDIFLLNIDKILRVRGKYH